MTDMGCSCICSFDYDPASVYHEKIRKARKEHICCECRETIKPGEKYEHVSGCWDGSWSTYKTCLVCLNIRKDLCCGSWLFGELRDAIWEAHGVDYITGKTQEGWDEEE